MQSERKRLTYGPLSEWQPADWQAVQPYCRALVATVITGIALGLVHLFIGLPTVLYFGLGTPMLLAYYLCVTRIKGIAIKVESRKGTVQQRDTAHR